MFVVNTISATVGAALDVASSPEKRVPSSRRRNPGVLLEALLTTWLWFLGRGFRSGRRRGRRARIRRRRLGGLRVGRRRVRRSGIGRRQARDCRVRPTGCVRGRGGYGRGLERLIEDRFRRAAARRRDRQQERQPEEQPTTPPARL